MSYVPRGPLHPYSLFDFLKQYVPGLEKQSEATYWRWVGNKVQLAGSTARSDGEGVLLGPATQVSHPQHYRHSRREGGAPQEDPSASQRPRYHLRARMLQDSVPDDHELILHRIALCQARSGPIP